MHICFLTSEYPPLPSGGIGTSIYNLANELVRQGHKTTVLGSGIPGEWGENGITVKFLGQTRIPKMGWLLNRINLVDEINKAVRYEGIDIVEAPDWTGLSAGMKLDCPLVIRCHGTDSFFGSLLGYHPKWAVFQAEKLALSSADGIAAVSKYVSGITKELFDLQQTIKIIPNGVDLGKYSISQSTAEEGLILYFGSLVRKKGVLDLARIFSKLVEKRADAKLLLVGRDVIDRETGKSTWELMQKAMTSKALLNTCYIGPQPASEMNKWIRKSVVCVFPSYAEALPVSWLEAMAGGKAIVASSIGWGPEIITDKHDGFLIHPADHDYFVDAILRLINEPKYRQEIGYNARKKIEKKFSIYDVAAKSVEWYAEVISNKGK